VAAETNTADEPAALAVLLHPHPDYGGDRFHPFIDGLFRRLPEKAVTTVRFDLSSAEPSVALGEVMAALEEASVRWPERAVVLAGYSFGAGIAAGITDKRIAGWYLLAPPAAMLSASSLGGDHRPKAIVVPALDQFSPPASIAEVVGGWEASTVTSLPNTDHFLGGAIASIVDDAVHWIEGFARRSRSWLLDSQDERGGGVGGAPAG
jgi:alpha/beta superfamily hydrolase